MRKFKAVLQHFGPFETEKTLEKRVTAVQLKGYKSMAQEFFTMAQ